MKWNYRIVKDTDGLRICDIYYDDAGRPKASHAEPTHIYGATVEELREQLALITQALDQPILEERSIGGHSD